MSPNVCSPFVSVFYCLSKITAIKMYLILIQQNLDQEYSESRSEWAPDGENITVSRPTINFLIGKAS